jgi:hypothetical protein
MLGFQATETTLAGTGTQDIFRSFVKLSRYMPWRYMGERRYSSYSYLTSALDGGE